MKQNDSKRRRIGLFAGAIFALLAGSAMVVLWLHEVVLRSLGLILCVAGVYLAKASNIAGITDVLAAKSRTMSADRSVQRPSALTWSLGGLALGATAVTFEMLYRSARGHHYDLHAAYAFTAAAVLCGLVWVYILSKLR